MASEQSVLVIATTETAARTRAVALLERALVEHRIHLDPEAQRSMARIAARAAMWAAVAREQAELVA